MSDSEVIMSFGHKPKEGARTFNPIPMTAESVLKPHRDSKKKAGFMSTTMLYNLLHPSSSSSSSSENPGGEGREVVNGSETADTSQNSMRMTSRISIQSLTPENLYDNNDNNDAELPPDAHDTEPSIEQVSEVCVPSSLLFTIAQFLSFYLVFSHTRTKTIDPRISMEQ